VPFEYDNFIRINNGIFAQNFGSNLFNQAQFLEATIQSVLSQTIKILNTSLLMVAPQMAAEIIKSMKNICILV